MRLFDYSSLKDFHFDNEIVNLLTKIHEHKGKQEIFLKKKPAVLNKLVDLAKIQSVEDSNKIEGIVTTSTRIKQLMSDKTTPQNRDEEEILGYRDVLNTIHESYEYIPISKNFILQLHKELYKYSEKGIGGKFKNTQNSIIARLVDGTLIEKFRPLAPHETPGAIEEICTQLNRELDKKDIDSLIVIIIFIHDFLCVHPFNDGNGRMSRLLSTLLLYRSGYFIGQYISLESKIEKNKDNYYYSLEQSGVGWHDNNHNPIYFLKYMLKIILAAYIDFEERVGYFEVKESAKSLVKSAIDNKLGKFTKSQLAIELPKLGKATIEKVLKELVESGYILRYGQGRSTFYVRNFTDLED